MSIEVVLAGGVMLSLTMYVLLGGADFGAGIWELLAVGTTRDRQLHLIEATITPVWEVNQIWLVFVVVLLFSGFPTAFAGLMSALFVPALLMLIAILFRGAAFAFRAPFAPKAPARRVFARGFAISSLLTPVFMGVAFGTIAQTTSASAWSAETNGTATQWLTPFSNHHRAAGRWPVRATSSGVPAPRNFGRRPAGYFPVPGARGGRAGNPAHHRDYRARRVRSTRAVASLSAALRGASRARNCCIIGSSDTRRTLAISIPFGSARRHIANDLSAVGGGPCAVSEFRWAWPDANFVERRT
jgi:hypothetical protein